MRTLEHDPGALRARLGNARLMLLYSPALAREPLAALAAALPHVDVVQVRPKPAGDAAPGLAPAVTEARAAYEACLAVLALCAERATPPLVLVNDRVDVAVALWERGLAGVHLGQDDCPPEVARAMLGPGPLVGLSTHDADQLARAAGDPVDYVGFGPIHATPTKGYGRGLGPERAWVAQAASPVPLFPIGGIDAARAGELAQVGRAAVGSAILGATDPGAAAAAVRTALEGR